MADSIRAGSKRPRSSDASEIEVKRLASPVKRTIVGDVFTTPRVSNVREEGRQSSPKESSLQIKPITVPVSDDIPASITSFFHGVLGSDLRPIVIAHSLESQQLMDDLNLAWGVQYEFARGVTLGYWSWEDVGRVLREQPQTFTGLNVEAAPKVGAVMRNREEVRGGSTLWYDTLFVLIAVLTVSSGKS